MGHGHAAYIVLVLDDDVCIYRIGPNQYPIL